MKRLVGFCAASCAIVLMFGSPALAQATRTWVSGVGDDANPCSRTAPCKTFAGAISKTAAGGEIEALDPGGFGAVTITKSITIDGSGTFASVLASGTNGIVVVAGANDVVTLRGLSINGLNGSATAAPGINGIRFLSGAALHIESCVVFRFGSAGVDAEPSAASQLLIKDTVLRDNAGGGVLLKPGSLGSLRASLQNVRLERNQFGIRAEDNAKVSIDGSVIANNTNNGVRAVSAAAIAELNLQGSMVANNGTNGVSCLNSGATVRLATSMIVNNNVGLSPSGGCFIVSFGNNRIHGNPGGDGSPTTTVGEQ
jgi:hypothetical protein